MVFLFDAPEPRSFWMKNCHFALDMVFALKDGTRRRRPRERPAVRGRPVPELPFAGPCRHRHRADRRGSEAPRGRPRGAPLVSSACRGAELAAPADAAGGAGTKRKRPRPIVAR
ncbi:MAG: DUF192 domain-containing protein [Candidatus Moduliflexus flocculans]|nr:DUF192 domain-containing protein [Candidatus Moduliflexus flocculans]